MITAVYPGSFDPVTLGHMDIIERSSKIFDKVIVCVMNNASKKTSLFSHDERVNMLKDVVSELDNVYVDSYQRTQRSNRCRSGDSDGTRYTSGISRY